VNVPENLPNRIGKHDERVDGELLALLKGGNIFMKTTYLDKNNA